VRCHLEEGLIALERWFDAATALESALAHAREGGEPARVAETLKFRGMLERDRRGREQLRRHLYRLVSFELWHRAFLRG